MPNYDFKCKSCGRESELWFRMSTVPASITCQCGEEADRHWTGFSFIPTSDGGDPARFAGVKSYSREKAHFEHDGWVDKVETGTGKKVDWESH